MAKAEGGVIGRDAVPRVRGMAGTRCCVSRPRGSAALPCVLAAVEPKLTLRLQRVTQMNRAIISPQR